MPQALIAPNCDIDQDLEREVLLSDYGLLAWFEGYGWIRTKKGRLEQPLANPYQVRCAEVLSYCLAHNIPARLVKLKPRQKGSSTISVSEAYWLGKKETVNGVIIGGEYSQVDNLWQIMKLYHTKDAFDWPDEAGTVGAKVAEFGNGTRFQKETARDPEAGRSGTFQVVIATEAGRWKERGAANATSVITGLLACVPEEPGTLVVLESTAAGDYGMFYEFWQDALDLEWIRSGKDPPENWNGYFRVFSPFYEHADSEDKLSPRQAEAIRRSYRPEELEMVEKYHLRPGHISWYRRTRKSQCKNNPQIMKREYPCSPEEAFHSASNRRFNAAGLNVLSAEARQAPKTYGVLEPTKPPKFGLADPWEDARWLFRAVPKEEAATCIQFDPPRVGMRYLISVDTMTGASQVDADDPDHHCATVIREGYMDRQRGWQRPKVVAVTVQPCRWDIDIMALAVRGLSDLYGQCIIIPEENNDRGLILTLKNWGCNLYQRTSDDDLPAGTGSPKPTGKYGFRTVGGAAANTRNWLIENLARAIREWDEVGGGIEVPDILTVRELQAFVTNPKTGKAEAAEGWKDDRVMSLAIGIGCIGMGTPYVMSDKIASIPRDFDFDDWADSGGGGSSQFS